MKEVSIIKMSKLKVAVVGAHGGVGRLLINQLKNGSQFDTPLAIVRSQEHVDYFEKEVGVNASLTSIEEASVKELENVIRGYDAVVFSAGAGGKGGPARILTVDLDGNDKVVEAAENAGVKRFILVSAFRAQDRTFWENLQGLRNYYIAKKAAEIRVHASKLNYTILQPGSLENGTGTGKFAYEKDINAKERGLRSVQREDVASFIVASLLEPEKTVHKTVTLVNGPVPLSEFIENV